MLQLTVYLVLFFQLLVQKLDFDALAFDLGFLLVKVDFWVLESRIFRLQVFYEILPKMGLEVEIGSFEEL